MMNRLPDTVHTIKLGVVPFELVIFPFLFRYKYLTLYLNKQTFFGGKICYFYIEDWVPSKIEKSNYAF